MSRRQSVFISYSHVNAKEKEWVRKLATRLTERKCSVWFDEWKLRPGQVLLHPIEKGLRNSDAMVAVLSRGNESRANVLYELGVAIGAGKQLIPVVAKDADITKLPFAIRSRRFLTMGSPDEAARQIVEALQPALGEFDEQALVAEKA